MSTTTRSQPRTRRARRLAALVLTLAVPAVAGCGGSSGSSGVSGPVSTAAAQTTTSSSHTGAAPSVAAGHAAVVSLCSAQADGDPGSMGLCLARHGITVAPDGKMLTCLQTATDRAGVTACLTKYAR